MSSIPSLDRIKIFADGASLPSMLESARDPRISGFTTNPTLMRKAGISDYRAFAKEVLASIKDRPISFEVFADEFAEMRRQAAGDRDLGRQRLREDPDHQHAARAARSPLIRELASAGVKLNVTAICTLDQVRDTAQALKGGAPSVVSVFAGRIADTGRDPMPLMKEALGICRAADARIELLWASPRELLNIVQAARGRLRHHHGHARPAEEAGAGRQGPGRLQPRDRADVLPRRPGRRVQAVSGAGDFVRGYLEETVTAVRGLDAAAIDGMAIGLARVREQGGRLFILGVGGSAGHASHAVNDFRKICGFEAYAPTDNVSELTARVNDEGWDTSFSEWLKVSRLGDARRACWCFRSAAATARRTCRPTWCARWSWRPSGARRCSASSARTAAPRAAAAEACVIIPTVSAGSHHASHRGAVRGRLAPPGQPPGAQARGHQVGVDEVAHGRRTGTTALPSAPPSGRFATLRPAHACAPIRPSPGSSTLSRGLAAVWRTVRRPPPAGWLLVLLVAAIRPHTSTSSAPGRSRSGRPGPRTTTCRRKGFVRVICTC